MGWCGLNVSSSEQEPVAGKTL